MNLKDLQYFLAVAELQHFGQAAQRCHVSQPTLSGQIKKLEEQLGVQLLERANRRVLLTEVGEYIALSARRIMLEVDTIQDVAKSTSNPLSGKFRIGAFPTLATYVFPNLIEKVKTDLPDLRLILVESKTAELVEKLRLGELDAALLALPVYDDFLVAHKLFDDEFVLATSAGHSLAKKKSIEEDELKKHKLLLLEEGHCLRDQALDICQLNNFAEEQDFKATSLETLRQMVKAGTGITFMPKIAVAESDSAIRYIPFSSPAPYRTIGLVWRKTSARYAVIDQLIKLLEIK